MCRDASVDMAKTLVKKMIWENDQGNEILGGLFNAI